MVKRTMPYQTIIKDKMLIQQGDMDTIAKFNQLTQGIDLKGKTVLDVGCNEGFMCYLATQQGAITTGVDINRDYIKQAKANFPNLNFQPMKAEEITGNYDIIICSGMLHYVDLEKAFAQFARCAKQVLCDVWLHDSLVPIFANTHRGIYIPSRPAFINLVSKYFGTVEEKGPALSPDISKRFIFHISNSKPIQPECILIYGPPESGKSVLSRTYFNHLILRTDDIFFVWKDKHMDLMLSIQFFSDMFRGIELPAYIDFCIKEISNWLNPRVNRDIVIEGYELSFEDYRLRVIEVLKEKGWNVKEIKL